MNEQIRQLAEQAYFETEYDDTQNLPELMARFAELIVRECIKICSDVESDEELCGLSDGALVCMAEIKEHFGVEE